MRALPAAFLFALGGWGIPVAGILTYAAVRLDAESQAWACWIGGLFWTVPAVFGIPAYWIASSRREGSPHAWIALLFGLAFSALPLLTLPVAWLTNGRLDPEECLWGLPVAAAALGIVFARLTPLKEAR